MTSDSATSTSTNPPHLPPDYRPTILTVAQNLSAQLSSTFSSLASNEASTGATKLHSLGPINQSDIEHTRNQLKESLSTIRNALKGFQSILPPPPPLASNPTTTLETKASTQQIDKYLTLLKESSTLQGNLVNWLTLQFEINSQRLLLDFQDKADFPIRVPDLKEDDHLERTIAILEGLSKVLGLISFRDSAETNGNISETLSLGGKVMVVDLEIERSTGSIEKVKMSYVFDSNQVELHDAATRLEHSLAVLGKGHDDSKELQKRLKRCRNILTELTRLDIMTDESGVDCFNATEALYDALRVISDAENAGSYASSGHGLCVPRSQDHLARIIYHATPLARLSTEWEQADATTFASPDRLLALEEIDSLVIKLEDVKKSTKLVRTYLEMTAEGEEVSGHLKPSFDRLRQKSGQHPKFVDIDRATAPCFVAQFGDGVPVTKAVGRRIAEVLGDSHSAGDALGNSATNESRLSDQFFDGPRAIDSEARYQRVGSNKAFRGETELLMFVLHQKFEDVALVQEYGCAASDAVPGFLVTHVRFQAPAQLLRVIEILQEQQRLNHLIRSVLHPRHLAQKSPRTGAKSVSPSSTKRRRVEDAPTISLDDLFTPSSRTNLPIFVHIHASCPHPSLSLSFPSPTSPLELAKPLAIHISIDPTRESGYSVNFEGSEFGDKLKAEEGERVLNISGDLSLFMRWVVKSLA